MLALVQGYPVIAALLIFVLFLFGGLVELAMAQLRPLAVITWVIGGWALIWLPFSAETESNIVRAAIGLIAVIYIAAAIWMWQKFGAKQKAE